MIISIANQKGGCGKSTIATNLTTLLTLNGKKAHLVDADPQGSGMIFRNIRFEDDSLVQFTASQNNQKTVGQDIQPLREIFDYVIVDTGGRESRGFRSAIMGSDVVIIPMIPSNYDFWGSENTFMAVEEIMHGNRDLIALSVLSMVRHNKIGHEVETLIEQFEKDYPVKFMKSGLYDRVIYKYSVSKGQSIFETDEKDQKAIEEFNGFYNELMGVIER